MKISGGGIAAAVAAIVGLIGIFAEPVQAYVTAHPAVASGIAGVGAIVAALLKAPGQDSK